MLQHSTLHKDEYRGNLICVAKTKKKSWVMDLPQFKLQGIHYQYITSTSSQTVLI
jgi:hypothetical protein